MPRFREAADVHGSMADIVSSRSSKRWVSTSTHAGPNRLSTAIEDPIPDSSSGLLWFCSVDALHIKNSEGAVSGCFEKPRAAAGAGLLSHASHPLGAHVKYRLPRTW